MNENKEDELSSRNVNVSLFDEMDDIKSNDNIFDDNLEKAQNSPIYEKTEEELYIATSPSFPLNTTDKSVEDISNFYNDESTDVEFTKVKTKCDSPTNFQLQHSLNTNTFDDIDITTANTENEYIPLKISPSDSFSINTIDGQYYISTDYNNLTNEASKTYFYVLSPNIQLSHLNVEEESIAAENFDTSKLINESVSITSNNTINTHAEAVVATKDKLLCSNEEHLLEKFDSSANELTSQQEIIKTDNKDSSTTAETPTRLQTISNQFVELESDLNDFSNAINSLKSTNQLVFHRLSPTESPTNKKSKEETSESLMKLNTDTKIHLPLLHAQPYLQVAINNDLEPSNTSELVSANQILGVTIPEVFSCKWEGCGIHKLSRDHLIQHVNNNHIVTDDEFTYICRWKDCVRYGKPFNARYKMLKHLRTHTGEKPHVCNIFGCQQAFARIENLKIHQRSHTGEKPYHCQYEGCGKTFANSSDRFKHKRTHAEKRPYKCLAAGCDKSYTDPSSLRKHRKKVHETLDRAVKRFGVS